MKIKIAVLATAFTLALSACAGTGWYTDYYEGQMAVKKGDMTSAERWFAKAAYSGELRNRGLAWNDLGVIYLRSNRKNQAITAFAMAARYGEPLGGQNLRSLGIPAPQADLLGSVTTDVARQNAELANIVVDGMRGAGEAYNRPSPPTVIVNNPPPKPAVFAPVVVAPPPPPPRTCYGWVNSQYVNVTCYYSAVANIGDRRSAEE